MKIWKVLKISFRIFALYWTLRYPCSSETGKCYFFPYRSSISCFKRRSLLPKSFLFSTQFANMTPSLPFINQQSAWKHVLEHSEPVSIMTFVEGNTAKGRVSRLHREFGKFYRLLPSYSLPRKNNKLLEVMYSYTMDSTYSTIQYPYHTTGSRNPSSSLGDIIGAGSYFWDIREILLGTGNTGALSLKNHVEADTLLPRSWWRRPPTRAMCTQRSGASLFQKKQHLKQSTKSFLWKL